jgi:hypothetical protein
MKQIVAFVEDLRCLPPAYARDLLPLWPAYPARKVEMSSKWSIISSGHTPKNESLARLLS